MKVKFFRRDIQPRLYKSLSKSESQTASDWPNKINLSIWDEWQGYIPNIIEEQLKVFAFEFPQLTVILSDFTFQLGEAMTLKCIYRETFAAV